MATTELTGTIVRRVLDKRWGVYDPCVICGHTPVIHCPDHTLDDTKAVIDRVKFMTKAEKAEWSKK